MRKLIAFETVSLDGFFTDAHGDMSWAHRSDPEYDAFVAENASGGGTLLFGRVTYEMMVSFWPTPQAAAAMPVVAKRMNEMPKIVFSRSMASASWKNTTVVKDVVAGVRKLKSEPGEGMAILGSGSIVSQLTQAGLIDELQIVTSPIIVGKGRTLFETVDTKLKLRRTKHRAFENGCVFACYEPVG